jgi:undecaprenyl-diphosphatase
MEQLFLALIVTQIIVESMPISSSGHVRVFELLFTKAWGIKTFLPDFIDHLLHGTALIAILIVFFKDWFYPIRKLLQSCIQLTFSKKSLSYSQRKLFNIFLKIIGLVVAANLITSLFYFPIKFLFKDFFANPSFLLSGFIITMLLLLSLAFKKQKNAAAFDLKKALILGCVQGLAVLPGISRFASTYAAGYWLNLRPARAMQISFLLHLPLIIAAFIMLGVKPLITGQEVFFQFNFCDSLIVLIVTAIAILCLKLSYRLAIKNKLWWFGIYMIIPILILLYLK